MAAAGPFEPRPVLAVALSGGGDSAGLYVLARQWCISRDGRAVALIVDHGLRTGSAAEAAGVAAAIRARGGEAVLLTADRVLAGRGVQAAARELRYRLMTGWCRRNGVAHLLVAHQSGDLAETLLMRLARGGEAGLAAMPLRRSRDGVRLIRPVLGLTRDDLAARARRDGLQPVTDPGNADRRFERVRWRERLETIPAAVPALAACAGWAGASRQAAEALLRTDLAACAAPHPAGFVRLDRIGLLAMPAPRRLAVLRAVLACVGGRAHPAGETAVARAWHHAIVKRRAASLSGAVLRAGPADLLVVREARGLPAPLTVAPAGGTVVWDRFRLRLAPAGGARLLAALGDAARPQGVPTGRWAAVPPAARRVLPALWRDGEPEWVAFLTPSGPGEGAVRWQPVRPLVPAVLWEAPAPL